MTKLLLVLLVVLWASIVEAQTTLVVDIDRASLKWDWAQGTGGPVDEFLVKCGSAPSTYSRTTSLLNPAARTLAVRTAITGSGLWYCAVSARNKYGESANSNEVFFDAGVVPSSPTNLTLQVQ